MEKPIISRKSKRSRRIARDRKIYCRAFVDGAKWWEWHKEGATMWPSDQALALKEAEQRNMKNMKKRNTFGDVITEIPTHRCSRCGHKMDRTTDAYGNSKPRPGDFSMCLACGFVSVFNEQLIPRMPTQEEKETILKSMAVLQAQLGRDIVVGDKIIKRDKLNIKRESASGDPGQSNNKSTKD